MDLAGFYFSKYKALPALITEKPADNLSIIVAIPCFKEDNTLKALEGLYSCTPTKGNAEVIVLVNYPSSPNNEFYLQHQKIYNELQDWVNTHKKDKLKFHILLRELPLKTAGAGLARKIVMDEALRRFGSISNTSGIIVSYDADCTCSTNYLSEIENYFLANPKTSGCSIYFEHPVSGSDYSKEHYSAIVQYELYMRYYVAGLRYAGYPHAYFTIGSAFAVRADAYARQGGMNQRKAGEDFYFLHKLIPLGNFSELNTTTVFPSPRISDRVPFGTGTVISKIIEDKSDYLVFNPEAFKMLKDFMLEIDNLYKSDTRTVSEKMIKKETVMFLYLISTGLENAISECKNNTSGLESFRKRFFRWFDGLKVLQCLNYLHENSLKKIPVGDASMKLLEMNNIEYSGSVLSDLLIFYRKLQKE